MKSIIVIGTIGGEEKQIILTKDKVANLYHIYVDKKFQGQVLPLTGKWSVRPHQASWLKGENCDLILRAVLSAEFPDGDHSSNL